eukprot:8520-Heterococcus_DN1.PRE.10
MFICYVSTLQWPAVKGARDLLYFGHAAPISGVRFSHSASINSSNSNCSASNSSNSGDKYDLFTAGGADGCVLQWRIVPCATLDNLQQQQQQQQAFGSSDYTGGSSGDYSAAAAASAVSSSGVIRCQTATLSTTTNTVKNTAVYANRSSTQAKVKSGSSGTVADAHSDQQQRSVSQQRDSNGHPYYTTAESLAAAAAAAAAANSNSHHSSIDDVQDSGEQYTTDDTVDDDASHVQQDSWPTDMQLPFEGGYTEGLAAEFTDPSTGGDSYEQLDFTASDEFDAFGPDA